MKEYRNEIRRLLLMCLAAVACIVVALLLQGCRSKRETVTQNKVTVSVDSVSKHSIKDSMQTRRQVNAVETAAGVVETHDSGMVMIDRDMSGRPVLVKWNAVKKTDCGRTREISGEIHTEMEANRAESAIVSKKADEIHRNSEEMTEFAIPWECWVGWSLFAMIALYLLYLFVVEYIWPLIKGWKR